MIHSGRLWRSVWGLVALWELGEEAFIMLDTHTC